MQFVFSLFGQRPNLQRWRHRSVAQAVLYGPKLGDYQDNNEVTVAREIPGPPTLDGPYQKIAYAILDFDIYPKTILTGITSHLPIKIDDIIGNCYHLFPGLDVFFATKVTSLILQKKDTLWQTGFVYQTLTGHPETGEASFWVEKNTTTGDVSVHIRSWSRPGTFLARLFKKLIRRWQLAGKHAALKHLASQCGKLTHVDSTK